MLRDKMRRKCSAGQAVAGIGNARISHRNFTKERPFFKVRFSFHLYTWECNKMQDL